MFVVFQAGLYGFPVDSPAVFDIQKPELSAESVNIISVLCGSIAINFLSPP
jgi:hypothetical protein